MNQKQLKIQYLITTMLHLHLCEQKKTHQYVQKFCINSCFALVTIFNIIPFIFATNNYFSFETLGSHSSDDALLVFWVITPYGFSPEDGDSIFLQNTGTYL
jgi:hypothetical protein